MAGSNQILRAGQSLFKEGDPSDGMYLVRSGELVVYLERAGNQVKLASIQPGAMIGEMAFFDQKPRSASIKAVTDAEVTKISNEDFSKLMKQIPKWFVSLMASLSTRLRETNERVQGLEAKIKASTNLVMTVVRVLHLMNLLWHKDGIKEGKEWLLEQAICEKEATGILGIEPKLVVGLIDVLAQAKVFAIKQNSYKNKVLAITHRSTIQKLAEFLEGMAKNFPDAMHAPKAAVEIVEVIAKLSAESAYESLSIPYDDLVTEGVRQGFGTQDWQPSLAFLKVPQDALSLVKVSGGKLGVKVNQKELARVLECYRAAYTLHKLAA